MMGAFGGLLVSAGSVVSMTGNNMGQLLSGSRTVFALAENGDLPAVFARVHPDVSHAATSRSGSRRSCWCCWR